MKKALLAAVLLLHAATAGAADIAVSSDANMTTANATAVAGDRVLIANGTYTVAINPAVSGGSSTRITYIGNIASPGSVVVPGLSITKNYITVKGVASTGGLSISGAASSDSIIYCTGAAGAPTIGWGTLNVIAYCTTTTTGNVYGFDCENTAVPESGALGSHNYIGYCDITAADYSYRGHDYLLFEHNRLTLTIPNGAATDQHFGTMYVCRWFLHRDNHITGINNSGEERRLLVLRDSTLYGAIVRDTLIASTSGKRKVSGIWTTSGAYNRVERNRIDSCFVKCGREAVVFQQDSKWMTIKNSVLISDSARVVQLDGAAYDSLTFEHNTCANITAPADRGVFMQDGTAATNRRVKHNIFYSPSNSTASNGTGIGTFHGPVPVSGNKQEYNLFFSRSGAGSTAAVKYQFTYSAVGTGTAWNGQASAPDSFSVWGSPVFTDSSWATFNPALGSGSFASGGSWPDGYVGAIDPAGADVTAPDAIPDLAVNAQTSTTLTLNWEAAYDDVDQPVASYDLRRSTSTITEGNWSSATQLTGEPSPQVNPNEETFVDTGLSPSTTYYYAVKSADFSGNISALSNVASGTTSVATTDGVTLGQLEVYPNFNAAGVRLWYSGDDNQNSTAKMYLTAGASASTDTLDLAFDPDTLRNERMFAGSVFWLSEGTQYTVNVVVTDADGGSGSASNTFTTRTVVPTNPTGTSYYVAAWGAGSDSAAGTAGAPFRTMQKAWSVMGPGDAMRLMAGAHRDTMTSVAADSGTVAAPKHIIGEAGSYISGADPAYLVTSGWDSLTAAGQKLYFKTGFATYPRVVCFGDSMRLFRHKTANSIATDSLGTLGNLQYGWARSKSGDTLYVQLEGGASPNGYACNIASRTFGITIRANNVVLDGVGTRYFGTDWRTDYYGNVGIAEGTIQLYNVKNVTVRNGYFLNNGWDAISSDSLYAGTPVRDITIERNIFRDTRVYGFDPATNFTIEHHPVVFSRGSRGTVVRYNTYRGFKDGGFRIDEIGPGIIGDVDFHNNDLRQFTSDSDAMEPDPCYCVNVRFWNNLVVDGGNAIDNESHRGPMYFIYNRFVRLQNAGAQFRSNYAFSDRPSESYYRGPTYYMHNTFSGLKSGASLWTAVGDTVKGVFAYNNIGQNTGDRPIDDATAAFTGFLDKSAWNYNFYVNSGSFLHKLAGANYAFSDTTAMRAATGYDANSKVATGIAFADTANLDFTPAASNPAVQRGRLLRGINTTLRTNRFSGAAPTMGAVDFDNIRPGPPTLTFAGRGLVSATVRWTAVGDDSLTDTASYYDLRISTSAINSGNFASATQLSGEPTPGVPGTVESYTATGLTKGTTYYFGLLVYDEVGNPSALATTSGTTKSANAVRYKWYSPWTWIRSLFP